VTIAARAAEEVEVRRSRACRRYLLGALGLGLAALVAAQPVRARQARPRLGLALGGGAAKGLAHVGVLRWFEEHRVPIDAVAGTSMGGLVGGVWAAGTTPAALDSFLQRTDWGYVFLPHAPYGAMVFRRKDCRRSHRSAPI
jgi:NTE family protein